MCCTLFSGPLLAVTLEELAEKVEALSRDNARLRALVDQLVSERQGAVVHEDLQELSEASPAPVAREAGFVRVDHDYSYAMLDATSAINRKQLYLLNARQSGALQTNAVYMGGAITAIADYQKSNTESKFGYLMRHPTAANQRTKTVSEAVIHSAQLQMTAALGDWTSGYIEILYDPEQSFGPGTITDLNRNQLQVRRGYVLFGNLDKSPYYLSLGKMAIPFGLTDTLNPFTASTVWHAFGGLAYGVTGGYSANGIDVRVMGVQGGAQFRAANVPVDHSNIPSKLNNFAVDASYGTTWLQSDLLVGASYIKGSAYCQSFPVTHFSACEKENGAYGVYGSLAMENWRFQAEYARTEDEWAGTFNPDIPQFAASDVTSWDVGGQYRTAYAGYPVDLSLDFSRFVSGPEGSPWERQDQLVLGIAGYPMPSLKVFGEVIRTEGYAPLNFISGGNMAPGETHSEMGSRSNILMLGTNLAF